VHCDAVSDLSPESEQGALEPAQYSAARDPGQATLEEELALARRLEACLSTDGRAGSGRGPHQLDLAHALMQHVVEILEELTSRAAASGRLGVYPPH
jgi:hypothetical protein